MSRQGSRGFTRRLVAMALAIGALALLLLLRVLELQWLHHTQLASRAAHNAIATISIPAARGVIVDRRGRPLADNIPRYALVLASPSGRVALTTLRQRLAPVIALSDEDWANARRGRLARHPYEPVLLRRDLSPAEVAAFSVRRFEFPDLRLVVLQERYYPYGSLFAHALGYVGRDRLPAVAGAAPGVSTMGGKEGLEQQYDAQLRGTPGIQEVEVDVHGHTWRQITTREARAGDTLHTHLDVDLQMAAAKALGDRTGAVVAIEAQTGAVLVAYAAPSFDPNQFAHGLSAANWEALRHDPNHPLINRFLRATYPPGSTIKPFVGFTGLTTGVVRADTVIPGAAWYQIPGSTQRYYDWRPGGHGPQDLSAALRDSNDIYFYQLAWRLGARNLAMGLRRFGFGAPTGVDLPGERAGLVPDPDWLRQHHDQAWTGGQTVLMGIGQGYLNASIMQLAQATATLTRQGHTLPPRLVGVGAETQASWPGDADAIRVIMEAMRRVVTSGTAHVLASDPHEIGGKTGTAQVHRAQRDVRGRVIPLGDRHWQDHALFIAFAPAQAPRIVVAVIVEHGGHGGTAAAPVAAAVIDKYFETTMKIPA